MTKSRAPRLMGVALGTALTAASLAACDSEPETVQVTEDVYCTTEDGTIVDEDLCENDTRSGGGGFYFLSYGSYGSGHNPGHKVSGGNRIPYNDAAQRKSLGLPESGRVTSKTGGVGTTITRSAPSGKTGGVGGGTNSGSGSSKGGSPSGG